MSVLKGAHKLLRLFIADHKHHYHHLNSPISPLKHIPYQNFYASQKFDSKLCWKCGLERRNPCEVFCEECKTIQSPHETKNYFKIFNLEEKFDIDVKSLQSKYRMLQGRLHPDKFSNKSEQEKHISETYSSLVNKAYKSLQAPLRRAQHLLELHGDGIDEEQKVDDPEFLMEMMELNEELENCTDADKLRKLDIKNKNQLEMLAKSIDECFKENNLNKAKNLVIKMKYYSSLGNRINSQLRDLGIVD
ncbi:iron-sulfur cluster co-chaperone protein HscB [Anthonomus grandis grandis]|uniref:iron-sulfur cluster co-chaperone protein HscB n=1 Tax=Anthonomus grandis grandis TaxID=2921223 RepID=UPI0021661F7C|nr:iron-sulfur cluster co-chaperone protein HscB [Anthonomus grandis grandis]